MPFKSEAQRRWMHATHPAMAKRWEAETPAGKLPAHVGSQTATRTPTSRTVNPALQRALDRIRHG